MTIGKDFTSNGQGALELRLSASWLVCRQECIPQEGQFVPQVPAKGSTRARRNLCRRQWRRPLPSPVRHRRALTADLVLGASGLLRFLARQGAAGLP